MSQFNLSNCQGKLLGTSSWAFVRQLGKFNEMLIDILLLISLEYVDEIQLPCCENIVIKVYI